MPKKYSTVFGMVKEPLLEKLIESGKGMEQVSKRKGSQSSKAFLETKER